MEQRLRSHYASISRAIDFTKMADAKAASAVVLQIALIGALAFRAAPLVDTLKQFPYGVEQVPVLIITIAYGVCSLCSIGFAGWVFFPKTPRTGSSLIYFEDIASMPYEAFVERSRQINSTTIEQQLLQQIHQVSKIARKKMNKVKCALIFSGATVVLWAILMVWSSVTASAAN